MKFIISISLLILCIVISQSVDYYLQCDPVEGFFNSLFGRSKRKKTTLPTTTPPPTAPPKTPLFIEKYVYDTSTANKYLDNVQINDIYTSVKYAMNVPTIQTKQHMLDYLNLLETQLNGKPLPNLIYFCISLPSAFKSFYLPDDTIPIPYNELHSKNKDIFPHSASYKQVQTLSILWNFSMILLTPSGPIMDPKSEIFMDIIGGYISQIKDGVRELKKIYTLSSLYE